MPRWHLFSSHPAIDASDAARGASGVHVGQPAPKIALKASHKVCPRPEECLGWTNGRPHAAKSLMASSRVAMVGKCLFSFRLIFVILAKLRLSISEPG